MTRQQCSSCGGDCKKSGCERADVRPKWSVHNHGYLVTIRSEYFTLELQGNFKNQAEKVAHAEEICERLNRLV